MRGVLIMTALAARMCGRAGKRDKPPDEPAGPGTSRGPELSAIMELMKAVK